MLWGASEVSASLIYLSLTPLASIFRFRFPVSPFLEGRYRLRPRAHSSSSSLLSILLRQTGELQGGLMSLLAQPLPHFPSLESFSSENISVKITVLSQIS